MKNRLDELIKTISLKEAFTQVGKYWEGGERNKSKRPTLTFGNVLYEFHHLNDRIQHLFAIFNELKLADQLQ